jgi:hypothetical protein
MSTKSVFFSQKINFVMVFVFLSALGASIIAQTPEQQPQMPRTPGVQVTPTPIFAPTPQTSPTVTPTPVSAEKKNDPLKNLQYRLIGPFRGGRVDAVAGVPTQPNVYYFGATGGGVWKTTDGGANWENVSDGFFKTGSVGAIAVSESDPNVVYVGMGEETVRGNVSHGDGVYKSTDAGKTWKFIGLGDTRQISRIRVHPKNPDIAYVAAIGHLWRRIRNAAFSKRLTADERGGKFFSATRTRARLIWFSTRLIRMRCLPQCGKSGVRRGDLNRAAQAARCINRPTAVKTGRKFRATKVCRRERSAKSALPCPRSTRIAFGDG